MQVSEKESTEYFQSRPRGSQVGAWALHQSRPVESRGALEANVKTVQVTLSEEHRLYTLVHLTSFPFTLPLGEVSNRSV